MTTNRICVLAFSVTLLVTLLLNLSGGKTLISPPAMTARFESVLTIDESALRTGEAVADCVFRAEEDLQVLGVSVPCPCLSTADLPCFVRKGQEKTIRFRLDLTQMGAVVAGESRDPEVVFFSSVDPDPIATVLRIKSLVDIGSEAHTP